MVRSPTNQETNNTVLIPERNLLDPGSDIKIKKHPRGLKWGLDRIVALDRVVVEAQGPLGDLRTLGPWDDRTMTWPEPAG
ncbi:hypothetical protein DL771_011717 [Monosporascus sp. 5C6A]|nr:hypothetical protein DL771_011717 [Monosporascus sp. 5C6A]